MSKKIFVLDTSIPVYDFECLSQFGENTVILPAILIEEINKLKDEHSDRGYAASQFTKILENLSKSGSLEEGVQYGKTLVKVSNHQNIERLKSWFSYNENDYKIISCAMHHEGTLVSRDRMLRVMASMFVTAEDYHADIIKTKELYKGYRYIAVPEPMIGHLFTSGLANAYELYPNEFAILVNESNPAHTAIGVMKGNRILPLDRMLQALLKESGLKLRIEPLNLEQKMYLYLLLDPDILAVSAMGPSGKGKTLQAVDVGLASVEGGKKHQLLYTKSIIPTDKKEDLGFFPGDMNEKIANHIKPLYNSIEHLYKKELRSKGLMLADKILSMREKEIIDALPLALLRGTSIDERFIILDEGQNTSNRMMKTFLTRPTDASKSIVMGDIEQIDDPHLTKHNNGLSNMIERGKTEDYIGHITMDISPDSRRGKVATFGSTKM
ncbi:PhoH family protein [Psychrobacillus sp. FSL K6-1464]|uniref:PhoH family protein n=1 Tax=Psychrobacillus sp. FSL K6-1464 TaxID=2921545 RepID=UPI0030F4D7D6